MTTDGLNADPELSNRTCDGPDCEARVGIDPAVTHPAHDVVFCSRACRNRWQNHFHRGVRE